MTIERFYDEALAHASYVVIAGDKAVVVDPGRDPKPYYDFVKAKKAKITGVIETHPHADFISSHLEIANHTGATIYVSKLVGAEYPHQTFDEGEVLPLNGIKLKAIHTPGHSPDSISVLVEDQQGRDYAIFTGDSLFIGDVGRPDLREKAGNLQAKRRDMARQMYHTVQEKFLKLPDDVRILPAHGAGSLCGKNMSDKLESTIGEQKRENPNLRPMSESEFVDRLVEGQPFIPQYFSYDVELNKKGAPDLLTSMQQVPRMQPGTTLPKSTTIVDTRPEEQFKRGHPKGAINIQLGEKFETWLGTLLSPGQEFFLVAENDDALETAILRAAKIGYEKNIRGATDYTTALKEEESPTFNLQRFREHPRQYTVVDVRNQSEVDKEGLLFDHALHIPLSELSERIDEIPTNKPIVVHCSGGYRSAAAFSILSNRLGDRTEVYDLSQTVKEYEEKRQQV